MSRNTIFIEDMLGPGWENEIGEDMRIEPREPVVRGLTASRYRQLWRLFPSASHNSILQALGEGLTVGEVAEAEGLSERQVKNLIATFITRASAAVAQKTFLPQPVASSLYTEKRPRSRRGRPPKALPMAPGTRGQEQVALPF